MGLVKQVIIVRRDLKMRRGKEIAQGSHAAMAWMSERLRSVRDGQPLKLSAAEEQWSFGACAKVCVRVNSEEELRAVHEKALAAGIESHLIIDSGRTEFGGVPTATACALGPDAVEKIDAISGDLELY